MYEVFNWGYTNDEPPKRYSLSIVGSEINIDGPPLPAPRTANTTSNINNNNNSNNTKNTSNTTENNSHHHSSNNHHFRQYSNHTNFYTPSSSAKGEDAV